MSRKRVLISCPLIQDSIDQYADQFAEHDIEYEVAYVDQHLAEEELLGIIDQYDAVLAGDDEFTATVFDVADRLEVISKWGIGTDNIDESAAEKTGVSIYNTPGAFADEVADVVIGYAILLTRQLHSIDRQVRSGRWACPRGVSLGDRTMGIVGVGSIGAAVARRAAAHEMQVVGNDIQPISENLKTQTGITSVEIMTLFEQADIVSLNCPLTEQTEGLVGEAELTRLGPEGYLINTARGELINEAELIAALKNGHISGAALDVFEQEPLPSEHPLTQLDNVILGSHNAQNTVEAVAEVNDRAISNLISGLSS